MTNRFPVQADASQFYGNPSVNNKKWERDNLVNVQCPWELDMDGKKLHTITIHKKLAHSLTVILNNVWDAVHQSQEAINTLHYDRYSGSYNYRPIRGGHGLSMHSYGAAIDWDADENAQHSMRHFFKEDSLLIVKFKEEGWVWGGDWSPASIDAMHVQAARVYAGSQPRHWYVPYTEYPVVIKPRVINVANTAVGTPNVGLPHHDEVPEQKADAGKIVFKQTDQPIPVIVKPAPPITTDTKPWWKLW